MSNEDTTRELQAEWRSIVLSKLNGLESGMASLNKDITDIKLNAAKLTDLENLREQVDDLRLWKAKVIGICIGINVIGVGLGWLIQTYVLAK